MAAIEPPFLGEAPEVEVAWAAILLRYAQAIFNEVQGLIDHNTLHQCIKGSREDIDPWVKAQQIVERTRLPLGKLQALGELPAEVRTEVREFAAQVVFLAARAQNAVHT